MKELLNESLPPLIPEYPVEVAGYHLTLRFDVNINKTKKGVKLQFVMKDLPTDVREVQKMANEIGTELQEKFGAANMQIVYDVENPYKNVVGFLLPLPSLADYIIKHVLKNSSDTETPQTDTAPDQELPPKELPLTEAWLKKMAGI